MYGNAGAWYVVALAVVLSSCAQVVAPGGGPRDVRPPRVVKYSPDSAAVNFSSRSIVFTFDEYVQLRDIQTQLLISPPLLKRPEIIVRDKNIIITLAKEDTLKANTTYVMSFGNAIQDINEGNAKENFKYVFSTGGYIDSLSISGNVQTAFDLKAEKNSLVMLYKNTNDSVVFKNTPDYFSKTNADGSFIISNLAAGKYKIIALKDDNGNYKYDETESIAFADSAVDAAGKNKVKLMLFNEPLTTVYLKKYVYNTYGKIQFYFNQAADSIYIKPINCSFGKHDTIVEYSAQRDSLTLWFRNVEKDSLLLQLSRKNKVLDTIRLKLISKEEALKNKKNPIQLKVVASLDNNQTVDLTALCQLVFNTPISAYNDTASILLREDSLLWNACCRNQNRSLLFSVSNNRSTYCLHTSDKMVKTPVPNQKSFAFNAWKPNTTYHLLVPPATFKDFYGFANDSISIRFKTREETYYGTLKLNITIPPTTHSYIVLLLDEKGNAVDTKYISSSQVLYYQYLQPAKYKLKIIYDDNNNHQWDTGSYLKKVQAEKVIYNSELINIRSNWDLELSWTIQ